MEDTLSPNRTTLPRSQGTAVGTGGTQAQLKGSLQVPRKGQRTRLTRAKHAVTRPPDLSLGGGSVDRLLRPPQQAEGGFRQLLPGYCLSKALLHLERFLHTVVSRPRTHSSEAFCDDDHK